MTDNKSKPILIGVGLLAVIGAGYFLSRGEAEQEAQLDTPESAEYYICPSDGYVFTLTPAQLEELLNNGGLQTSASEERGGGTAKLRHPQTGAFDCVAAKKCASGKFVPQFDEQGAETVCP